MPPHREPSLLLLCVAFWLAPHANAQLGHASGLRIDVQKKVTAALGAGYTKFYGAACDDAGNYWVTAQRASGATPHKLFKFASAGALLATYDQPPITAGSATGFLDLAYDSATNALYGSCETSVSGRRVFGFDIATAQWQSALEWIVPIAFTGASVRGLALDPYASGGPSLYAADLASTVVEFKQDGTLVRTFPNVVPSCTGIAIDALYRKLWFVGQGGSTRPATGIVAIAVDVASAQKTGITMLGDSSIPGTPMGGLSGGIEFGTHVHDHIEPFLLFLAQATSATIYELDARFNFGATCGGVIGFTNDAPYVGNAQWAVTLTGSTAANGFLLVSARNVVTPLTPPLFASGCALQVGLVPEPIAIGPYPVTGGAAKATLPILAGGGAEVWFQWVEVTNPFTLPYRLSDGGGTVLWP